MWRCVYEKNMHMMVAFRVLCWHIFSFDAEKDLDGGEVILSIQAPFHVHLTILLEMGAEEEEEEEGSLLDPFLSPRVSEGGR